MIRIFEWRLYVDIDTWVAGLVALALLIYLAYSLLYPERF